MKLRLPKAPETKDFIYINLKQCHVRGLHIHLYAQDDCNVPFMQTSMVLLFRSQLDNVKQCNKGRHGNVTCSNTAKIRSGGAKPLQIYHDCSLTNIQCKNKPNITNIHQDIFLTFQKLSQREISAQLKLQLSLCLVCNCAPSNGLKNIPHQTTKFNFAEFIFTVHEQIHISNSSQC